jgi:two-component system heavy metal sensor histidine kinase CusS
MFFAKIRRFFTSIRFRLTVVYLALMAITLSIFCAVLFQIFVRNHQQEFDFALYNHAVDVGQSISVDFFSGEFYFTRSALLAREKAFPFSLGKSFAQVIAPDGQIVTRSPNLGDNQLPIDPEDWQTIFLRRTYTTRTLSPMKMRNIKAAQPGESYRQIVYMVRRGAPVFVLQIAVPMTLLEKEKSDLLRFFFIGIPLALFAAALAGLYLAGNALKPVREIIKKAELLNPSNLSDRLPEPVTEDEIGMMTVTLNSFLGRIERAFESHEHFIADASHQLKTPLAILRGELDVFRSKPRSEAEVKAFVDSASQELQHLSRLLDDLLTLSKIEAGAGSLILREVRLDEVLLETVSRFEVIARKKGISVRFDLEDKAESEAQDDFVVKADPDLLLSMFRNLVDNAIKYSPNGSPVEVKLENESDRVVVHIKDYGDPIPPEQCERLFQRYERGKIHVGGVSGTGLGLTIAKRIAEMHAGKIMILHGNSPGKSFTFEMKKN